LRRAQLDHSTGSLVEPIEACVETRIAAGGVAGEGEVAVQPRGGRGTLQVYRPRNPAIPVRALVRHRRGAARARDFDHSEQIHRQSHFGDSGVPDRQTSRSCVGAGWLDRTAGLLSKTSCVEAADCLGEIGARAFRVAPIDMSPSRRSNAAAFSLMCSSG